MNELAFDLPARIWAVSVDTVGAKRINCSTLDHGPDYTAYVRYDLVDRLFNALQAQVSEHGPVTEDAIDILECLDDTFEEAV